MTQIHSETVKMPSVELAPHLLEAINRRVCVLTALACLFVPVDFVIGVPVVTKSVYYLSGLTLALVISSVALNIQDRLGVVIALILALSLAPTLAGSGAAALAGLYIGLPIAVGIIVARYCVLRTLIVLMAIMIVVLLAEYVARRYWYSDIFGALRFSSFASTNFRARGVIGQPVPAAFILLVLGAAAVPLIIRQGRRFVGFYVVLVSILVLAGLYVTGTRSALVASAIALLLVILAIRNYVNTLSLTMWTLGILIVTLPVLIIINPLRGSRVLDFGQIGNSVSGANRLDAYSVLGRLPDPCGLRCELVGHGGRALQRQLASGSSLFGFSTVDNQFVTLYWDFGIVGLSAVLALLVIALLVLKSGRTQKSDMGSIIVVLTIVSGLSYDCLYARPSALLLGVGIGLMLVASRQSARSITNNVVTQGAKS